MEIVYSSNEAKAPVKALPFYNSLLSVRGDVLCLKGSFDHFHSTLRQCILLFQIMIELHDCFAQNGMAHRRGNLSSRL